MKNNNTGTLRNAGTQQSSYTLEQEQFTLDSTYVYQERCPLELKRCEDKAKANADVNAHNLFSMFTADIIKQKTVFTR